MVEYEVKHNEENNITIETSSVWKYYPFDMDKLQEYGWKFYIALTPKTACTILDKLSPLLIKNRIPFKHPSNELNLLNINSGIENKTQIGKNIVLYIPNANKELLTKIVKVLIECDSEYPIVHYANPLFKDAPLYYRYGAYTSKVDVSLDNRYKFSEKLLDPEISEYIISKLELKDFLLSSNRGSVDQFLLSYPVIDIYAQSGKGGVFKSVNLNSDIYEVVALKIGYYLGAVQINGYDGSKLLQNELNVIKKIKSFKLKYFCIPTVLDFCETNRSNVIVYSISDGIPANILLAQGKLSVSIVKKCLLAINELHLLGYIWGDAKIGNFILSTSENSSKLYMHDFELTFEVGSSTLCAMRTFNIVDSPVNVSEESRDIIDFLVSILYDKDIDKQNQISLESFISRFYENEIQKMCQGLISSYLL